MPLRVVIVPGLGVRGYVQGPVRALRARGVGVELLTAPGQPGSPADLRAYGMSLGARMNAAPSIDMLVGLSVGAQAAAVAAAVTRQVSRLVLVSPTVDPQARSVPRLLARWTAGGRRESPRLLLEQAPDWWRSGPSRLWAGVRSAIRLRLEDVLPDVEAELTVVHAEHDAITSHSYAAGLAADHGGRLLVVPGGTHSWPYAHAGQFADTVEGLLR